MQTHWDQVHPEQICRRHQGEWCVSYAWRVDAMHRDLDKLKQWSCMNAEVQHGQVQASVVIKAWGWKDWDDTSEKDLGYLWMKSWPWADSMYLQPESQLCSGPGEVWPAGPGACLCPSTLLLWEPTWNTASGTGALSTRKMWTYWSRSSRGPQKRSDGLNIFYKERQRVRVN